MPTNPYQPPEERGASHVAKQSSVQVRRWRRVFIAGILMLLGGRFGGNYLVRSVLALGFDPHAGGASSVMDAIVLLCWCLMGCGVLAFIIGGVGCLVASLRMR